MDGYTDIWTDRQADSSIAMKRLVLLGYKKVPLPCKDFNNLQMYRIIILYQI